MSNTAIEIRNLSKVYKLYNKNIDRLKEAIHPFKKKYHRPFFALKNINLTVKKGEILGIVGRNGAGKSTLAKIITGVLTQTAGTCMVNGNISPLLGLAAGFNPDLTGIENIYLNGTIKGFSKKDIDDKMEDILSFADIGEFVYQPTKTFSSGMNARLGFAVAININPEILILDEVLSVGDELFKRKCHAKMRELFESGCTVLLVSHSLNSINDVCSRAIFIDRGEQILAGPPKFVTMYYQKYMYTTREEQEKARKEIIELNNNEKLKKDYVEKIDLGIIDEEFIIPGKEDDRQEQRPFFIPNFVPKSTMEYKNYDVEIMDIHIKTPTGEKVNALVTNEQYIFTYKVRFNVAAENVEFGMGIRTEKGFFLGGTANIVNNVPAKIEQGEEFLVEWHFRCNLLNGNYYINVGIKSLQEGESIFLNRIVDATVFKVQQNSENKGKYTGIINFSQHAQIKSLGDKRDYNSR